MVAVDLLEFWTQGIRDLEPGGAIAQTIDRVCGIMGQDLVPDEYIEACENKNFAHWVSNWSAALTKSCDSV